MGELTILHYNGAETVTWEAGDREKIRTIRNRFDALLEKGFFAIRISPGEADGTNIDRFDETAQKILMFPFLSGG